MNATDTLIDSTELWQDVRALQDNSPTENVLAMYETIQTHGRYA
jgi:hypothetical protein